MHETTSFEQLFAAHHARLLRMATLMLGDTEEAQDTVAEVFARAAEAEQPPEVQVITAAVRNRCLNRIRQMRIAERVRRRLPLDETEFPSWEQEAEHELCMEAVSEAIDTELTQQMRRTLLLRYRDEKTYREIAETMNISEVAVYKHLRNALERLKRKLNVLQA